MSNPSQLLTLVTLSPEPVHVGTEYSFVNHVSKFTDAAGLLDANVAAISKVKTPYFYLHDWDDPLPDQFRFPFPDEGLVFGDYLYRSPETGSRIARVPANNWNASRHLSNYLFIHRAVCNTAATHQILPLLPKGDFLYFFLIYFLLADNFGAAYVPEFEAIWQKGFSGMHRKVHSSIENTRFWLENNRTAVREALREPRC